MSDIVITDERARPDAFEAMWKEQPTTTDHRFHVETHEVPEGMTPEEVAAMVFDRIDEMIEEHS